MKIPIIAFLIVQTFSLLHAEDAFDPFVETDQQRLPSPVAAEHTQPKITTSFTCASSGTLGEEARDIRVKSIVIAISSFYEEAKRVPKGRSELMAFCEKRGLDLHDLIRLSAVEFIDGRFKYSAGYSNGKLHLSHISGQYLTSNMIQPMKKQNKPAHDNP